MDALRTRWRLNDAKALLSFALLDLLQAARVRASFDTRRGFAAALLRMRLDCLWHEQYSSS
jgi:hypothetical protein